MAEGQDVKVERASTSLELAGGGGVWIRGLSLLPSAASRAALRAERRKQLPQRNGVN